MDARLVEFVLRPDREGYEDAIEALEPGDVLVVRDEAGTIVSRLRRHGRKLSREERLRRFEAFQRWQEEHAPTLGPDLTLEELLKEGRRR